MAILVGLLRQQSARS